MRQHSTGTKCFHHPVVGDLEITFQAMELVAENAITLTIYTAKPASPTAERLQLLASWAATDAASTSTGTDALKDTADGPGDWFNGDAYVDPVRRRAPPCAGQPRGRHARGRAHWHRQPMGRTVLVAEGIGLCRRHGGPIEIIPPWTGCSSRLARSTGTARHPPPSGARRRPLAGPRHRCRRRRHPPPRTCRVL